jgi:selenocysteine lyase/cysteine desulfurase
MVKMIPETGELDWEDFSRQLNERTKLVAIGAASNALGTINDVQRAGKWRTR